jgi:phosphatidylserine/phosphatidylglycerophosphate/cardiolipin synthase-like enzyme
MAKIVSARAWANNEVAYIAWDVDAKIPGCLGFEVTRVYLDGNDAEVERTRCAAWVSFKGQRNPHWLPQDTGIWPVQKMSWRDVTLRKRRSGMTRRPDEVRVRYEIRPMGDLKPGLAPGPPSEPKMVEVIRRDKKGKPVLGANGKPLTETVKAYEGKPRPLGYLDAPTVTNPLLITSRRAPFRSTFTNGILAAQWLRNVLNEDGVIDKNELIEKLENPDDPHRKYLAGDVLPLIHELFRRDGEFYLALYELEDKELEQILVDHAARVHVILSNTGANDDGAWDARNAPARKRLKNAGVDLQNRMFNNSTHIGHNKFVVHVPPGQGPRAVLTGSTNWTSTGVAGQTNNALLIEDPDVAKIFHDYWTRLRKDKLATPKPLSAAMKDNQQGAAFRQSNVTATSVPLAGTNGVTIWFSPNTPERTKRKKTPPDLTEVYRRLRMAKDVILFLAFYPGQKGVDCVIGDVIEIGRHDRSLIIVGAVSSAQAMPNYTADKKEDGVVVEEGESPATFEDENVAIVRAARIDDRTILGDLGAEQLTAKGGVGAIIHDKVVVVDPRSPDCMVVLGSHNLGFKASYSNDENMVIVTGHQELAAAYAVHILDVYDHYRFRAIESDRKRKGKKAWSGFLETHDKWQDGYVARRKGVLSAYMSR